MKFKLLLLFIFSIHYSFGQNNKVQIEVTPYIRWDKYPEFTYAINPVNDYKVNIKGTSWGTNAFLRFYLKNKLFVKAGLGYYKYSFNNIKEINSLFRITYTDRIINYVPPGPIVPSITFATNKYSYNTVSLNVGVEKQTRLKKGIQMIYSFIVTNYFTISQHYHITYPYPRGNEFKQTNFAYQGSSAILDVGIQKTVKKTTFGPILMLPIFDLWKKDELFPQEKNNEYRSKWLNGIGVGIQINLAL